MMTFNEIEAKFGIMVTKIQESLEKHNVNLNNLLIKLKSSSVVRDREVPLFDPGIFERITSIDKLFETLSGYWHLFDYDVLLYLVDTAECEEAEKVYDDFLAIFDSTVMNNLILRCDKFNMEGILPGTCTLCVKVYRDKCTVAVAKEVKEIVSKHLELEKYALVLKGVKEGYIELIYQISTSVKSYILQYNATEHETLQLLKAHMITAIKIDDVDIMSNNYADTWEDTGLLYVDYMYITTFVYNSNLMCAKIT